MNTPTPTPSKDEVNLDNLPLKDALRFVDENSTTGGLFTKAALKTLAAKCRELTAVTEQRDEARKIATEYRNAFNEAFHDDYSSILNQLPWENNQPTEP